MKISEFNLSFCSLLKVTEKALQLRPGEDVRAIVFESGDRKSLDGILGDPSLAHQITTEPMKRRAPGTQCRPFDPALILRHHLEPKPAVALLQRVDVVFGQKVIDAFPLEPGAAALLYGSVLLVREARLAIASTASSTSSRPLPRAWMSSRSSGVMKVRFSCS